MGWTGQYNWEKPSDVRKDIERTWNENENWKIAKIASKAFGRRVWLLIENKDTARREIVLYLVDFMGGHYGYKSVSEDMGPYHYDCPIAFITAAGTSKSDYATAWREKVVDYHNKAAKKFFVGDVVEVYNNQYKVLSVRKRNMYIIENLISGMSYTTSARTMSFSNGLEEAKSMAKGKRL